MAEAGVWSTGTGAGGVISDGPAAGDTEFEDDEEKYERRPMMVVRSGQVSWVFSGARARLVAPASSVSLKHSLSITSTLALSKPELVMRSISTKQTKMSGRKRQWGCGELARLLQRLP